MGNVCLPDSWPCKQNLPDWDCSVVGGNDPAPVPAPPAPAPATTPPSPQPAAAPGGHAEPCYVPKQPGGCSEGLSCHKKSEGWNVCLPDSWPCKENLPDWDCSVVGGNDPAPVPAPPAPAPAPTPPSPQPAAGPGGHAEPCYVPKQPGGCIEGLSCHKKSEGWNVCLPDSWPCK